MLISILSLVFITFYFIYNKRFNWEHFVIFSIFIKLFYLSIIYFNSFSILYFILSTDLSTLSTFFPQVINIVIHIINLVFSRLWGTYQLIHSPYYYYYGYVIFYILYKASLTQIKNKIFFYQFRQTEKCIKLSFILPTVIVYKFPCVIINKVLLFIYIWHYDDPINDPIKQFNIFSKQL